MRVCVGTCVNGEIQNKRDKDSLKYKCNILDERCRTGKDIPST